MDVTVDLATVDPAKGLLPETLELACVQSAKDVSRPIHFLEHLGTHHTRKIPGGSGHANVRLPESLRAHELPV